MTLPTHHFLPQHSVTLIQSFKNSVFSFSRPSVSGRFYFLQVEPFPIYKLCLPECSADSSMSVCAVLGRPEAAQAPPMPWGDKMGWQEVEAASTSQAPGCRMRTHLVGQYVLYSVSSERTVCDSMETS